MVAAVGIPLYAGYLNLVGCMDLYVPLFQPQRCMLFKPMKAWLFLNLTHLF